MYIKVASKDDALKLSDLLKDGDWMVLYYAEWCGHCKHMKPEWQKVVNKMSNSKNINVADIESTHIGELANQPKVEGFPTIKMYNNGKEVANFQDERVANKMEKFALNNSQTRKTKKPEIMMEEPSPKENIPEIIMEPSPEQMPEEEIKINNNFNIPSIFKKTKTSKKPIKTTKKSKTIKPIKPISNKPIISKKPKMKEIVNPVVIPPINLPCNKIIKAKICKTNPKCMYDYVEYKCKNKSVKNNTSGNVSNKLLGKKLMKSKKSLKTRKTKAKNIKNNNIKKTTSNVFKQLIKSFKRIGNEAEKDAKILKKATDKI